MKENLFTRADLSLFFNLDCISGCRARIPDGAADLIITDPPYGIEGHRLHKHYHRKESFVLDGYIEVPKKEYARFTVDWVREAERILRPGGSIYIVSGYTHLPEILLALRETSLSEVNHIIWKYNFGVYTRLKYISSHYHILYYAKPGARPVFNTCCRFGQDERDADGGSLNYRDREDVWIINKEYKPGQPKNKNELPIELLTRLIQYSSNPGDLVFDLFLGGFSTARTALGLNRRAGGFELNPTLFNHQMDALREVAPGWLLAGLRQPVHKAVKNQGQPWSESDREDAYARFRELQGQGKTKKESIAILGEELGRGRFSILNVIDEMAAKKKADA